MTNEVFNSIVDAARTQVDSGPEYQEWRALYEALEKKLAAFPRELRNDVFGVVWHGMMVRGEGMFKLAWELRGNPDKLWELPEPE